jgi:hypothetical protein
MNNIEPGRLTQLLSIYTRFGNKVVAAIRHFGQQVPETEVFKGIMQFGTTNEAGQIVFSITINDKGQLGIKTTPSADLDVAQTVRFRDIQSNALIDVMDILAIDSNGFIFKTTIPRPIPFILNDHEPDHSNDAPSPINANLFIGDDFVYLFIINRWKRFSFATFDDRL